MIAVDTSVEVAGFASWHEGHPTAAAALARSPRIPCSPAFRHRIALPKSLVATFLAERFPEAPLSLPPRAYLRLIDQAASTGTAGGSIYDAVIAATALHAKARLLTRDRRAAGTYQRIGVEFEFLS